MLTPSRCFLAARRRIASSRQVTTNHVLSCFLSNRAAVFTTNGPPVDVIRIISFPPLPPPKPQTINIRYILSPINPSDINVIEGIYPAKPAPRTNLANDGPGSTSQPCFVVGNEGLAEVTSVGEGVKDFKTGDRVIMVKPQSGTWSSSSNVQEQDILKIPHIGHKHISDAQGATMTINPPTAYNMLKEFTKLERGEWIVQNGANSAVGQAVIQIASSLGLNTLNFVRERPDFAGVVEELKDLGATHVLPLELLNDKIMRKKVKEITGADNIRLALNCVSGHTTAALVGLLDNGAHLVSYGAMSKQPLTLPTSAFIFKGLTAHGFMQNKWYKQKSREERMSLMNELATLMVNGQLRAPRHMIFSIHSSISDEEATEQIRGILKRITSSEGKFGKKILIKFEE